MEIIAGQNSPGGYFDNHNGTRTPNMIFLLMGMNILVYALHVMQRYRGLSKKQRRNTETPEENASLLSIENMILIPGDFYRAPREKWPSILGSMFTHANLLHLGFNMTALYKFGRPLEHAMGPGRVFLIYMASGLMTNLIYSLINRNSHVGIVGASAAISGVGAAYFMEYSDRRNMSTWLAYQVVGALLAQESGISFVSHLIGFAIGALVYLLVRRR